ncbi:MAG: 16S rRNA (uracil1498-N3)-methyltransferase [Myxococcota bacterium]|jgi:16S rRNA (uracil1498-N3)-methyltransferase
MTRLVVAPERLTGAQLALEPAESRYLTKVLRLAPGAPVEVRDGAGHRFESVLKDTRTIVLGAREVLASEPGPRVHLCFAPPKGKRLDWLLEKATELGATSLYPVYTERSVRRDATEGRWQRIVDAAARQCAGAHAPTLYAGRPLSACLTAPPPGVRLVAHPTATDTLQSQLSDPRDVVILTGPEGGFAAAELTAITAGGFHTFGLGDRILRAETAPIVALTISRYLSGKILC